MLLSVLVIIKALVLLASATKNEEEDIGFESEDSVSEDEEDVAELFYNNIEEDIGNNIHSEPQSKRKRTFLDNYQRQNICEVLINSSSGRKINKGVVKRLSSSYQVSVDVIYAIWRQKIETGDVCHKKTKCGRKKKSHRYRKNT